MKKFNYIAPYNKTGYGIAAANYGVGFLENEVDFIYNPIGSPDSSGEFSVPPFLDVLQKNASLDLSLDTLIFWHASNLDQKFDLSKPYHVFTTFEIDTLSDKEIENLKEAKTIGTANQYHADILQNYFPDKKIYVAPHAFLPSAKNKVPALKNEDPLHIWKNLLSQDFPDDTLVISSAGKYETRKGHDSLLDALELLPEEKTVVLTAYWHNPFFPANYPYSEMHYRGYERIVTKSNIFLYKKGNKYIAFMPPSPDRQSLHGIIARSHLFVAPSRAEGFNLVLFEIMSLGIPCAATINSGHAEFCNSDNVIEIEASSKVLAHDPPFFLNTGKWFDVSGEAIYEAIQKFGNMDRQEVAKMTSNARKLSDKFTWEKSSKIILDNIL